MNPLAVSSIEPIRPTRKKKSERFLATIYKGNERFASNIRGAIQSNVTAVTSYHGVLRFPIGWKDILLKQRGFVVIDTNRGLVITAVLSKLRVTSLGEELVVNFISVGSQLNPESIPATANAREW